MKKKIIYFVLMILVLDVLCFYLLYQKNKANKENTKIDDKVVSIVTIDVNPSIELSLNKDNIVVSIKSLNEDGKKIIDEKSYKNIKIEDAISNIVDSLEKNNYLKAEKNLILINVDSNNDELLDFVKDKAFQVLEEKNITSEIIMQQVKKTEELKKIAEKNSISISKAHYIQEQIKDNSELSIEDFKDFSLEDISEKIEEYVEENSQEEIKTETNISSSNNNRIGSIGQCEYVPENFSKADMYEVIKTKVSPEISGWIGGLYEAYAVLYNGKCAWRMDLVDGNVDHSYIYDITTGEEIADISNTCYACTYDQILALVANYHGVSPDEIRISTASLGACGETRSDADYTLDGINHKLVFDRYSGNVISAS